MITIKEISILAQVSSGTVDRVIHKRPGVSKKTADKVNALLEEHNFILNDVASKLANRKKYHLATLLPSYDERNSFWKSPYMGILKGMEEVGFYGVQTNNYSFNQFDSSTYLLEFDRLIETQPDAVILVPVFRKETEKIVQRLEKDLIPYLFLNTDIEGYQNLSFIGQNSIKSGILVGKLMHVSIGGIPECLIVKLRENINNHQAISNRIEGFFKYFEEKNIAIKCYSLTLGSLKNRSEVKNNLLEFFKENPRIRGLYMPSSQLALLVDCLGDKMIEKLTLIGHDTTDSNLKCMQEDKISFLISQKPFNQGYDAVIMMTDYLLQHKIPVKKKYSPLEIITKENIE